MVNNWGKNGRKEIVMLKAIWVVMAAAILFLPYNLNAQCCCCSGEQAQQTQTQGQTPKANPQAAPGTQAKGCPFSQESGLHAKKAEKPGAAELAEQRKDGSKVQGK